jgi:hypothetical protein
MKTTNSTVRRLFACGNPQKIDAKNCGKPFDKFWQKMLISCGKISEKPLTN